MSINNVSAKNKIRWILIVMFHKEKKNNNTVLKGI